jgi:hypothetical protein
LPNPREPKAVKALVDKHTVQGQLRRMGLLRLMFGPAPMRKPDAGGTRNGERT